VSSESRRRFLRGGLGLAGAYLLSGCERVASPFGRDRKKPARVGFLNPNSIQPASSNLTAFRDGMRAHGYEEDTDYILEIRSADGRIEHLPRLAAELVNLRVDVIVTGGTPPTIAARDATTTIPILATPGVVVGLSAVLITVVTFAPYAYLFERGRNTVWAPALLHFASDTIKLVIGAGALADPAMQTATLLWLLAIATVPYLMFAIPPRIAGNTRAARA
jgi:hypothetical protein